MSRTVADPTHEPTHEPTAGPAATPRPPTAAARRARSAPSAARGIAIVVSIVLVVALLAALFRGSTRIASDRVDAVSYRTAIALEGVRPLVSDRIGELGTVESVTVKRTPDPDPAWVHLLAPAGEARARVSIVSAPEPARLVFDGRLADGRPYQVDNGDASAGRYASIATVGADGQRLDLMARDMTLDELVAYAAAIDVSLDGVVRRPAGWIELGDCPMPPWRHGMGTYYDFVGGRRLGITVERATVGREALAGFASTTEPIDLGTGEWAFRYTPPAAGMIFRRGDVVVDLVGDFSDAELLTVVHSLREMRPDEHPILSPDPYLS